MMAFRCLAAASALATSCSALQVTRSNPLGVSKAAQAPYRQTLRNFQNVQYYGGFFIGKQELTGIFDTGSFELLVRSTRCGKCQHPTPPYNRTTSPTYIENGTETEHVYGSGPCNSLKGSETVSVGPMDAINQSFWEITSHSIEALNTAKFAAIVGIGPNFAYGNKDSTLLMSFGVEEFSICLQRPANSDGFLTWGKTTDTKYMDKYYAKAMVSGKHHWVTDLSNVTFLNSSGAHLETTPCMKTGCAAIIDSGTSLIAAPGAALSMLSTQIEPIMEDCSNLHKLPTLRFKINGTDFELPPQAYVMRITGAVMTAESVWDVLFFKPKVRRVNMCMPAFMQIDMQSQTGPVWILGMPFFRYFHVTFDRVQEAMYFAKAGPNCSAEPFPFVDNNATQASKATNLLATAHQDAEAFEPMQIEVDALVPPTLSGMIDAKNGGIIEL